MTASTPTTVLVHGAFTDGSYWAAVADRLLCAGMPVSVPENPLRGLKTDVEALLRSVRQIAGSVLLVGHGYGGAVVPHAAARIDNVLGQVLVASCGIEQGRSIAEIVADFPAPLVASATGSRLGPPGCTSELFIHADRFAEVFAADLSVGRSSVMAVSQRLVDSRAFSRPLAGPFAGQTCPNWCLVTTRDQVIHPEVQRAAARRLQATTTEVSASHAVALSQPETVTVFILKALEALERRRLSGQSI
ncbi:alpha/beta fold hydrolase [Deinococcus sp. HMF7620]|uniref:Alpha/beta fold hydrolase n=1 Tax=Deinococcus arboris TaxID=2682977 RepID=A0A7C9M3E0_9DEIO|nr:alpha/beta hydrolase [Deinococcus arboris]MVN88242.1 alpha/beta fold hydrolase [Deinococcus arboris]